MQLILTIVSFLAIDGIWIYFVANPLYQKHLPESFLASPVRLVYALGFYLLFSFALWYLFIRKASGMTSELLVEVFLFGLTSYGTYSLTNMAIIEKWNLQVTLPDFIWGGILSVFVTIVVLNLKL